MFSANNCVGVTAGNQHDVISSGPAGRAAEQHGAVAAAAAVPGGGGVAAAGVGRAGRAAARRAAAHDGHLGAAQREYSWKPT